ncbi:hypothetical protein ANO11243_054040 [Dothideomycetidae sp. 11243]|nr:hypothetical protein ANO11243_054040 [fungal sp. No.11243]
MASEQEILANAARDGSLDVSEWPRVLENVLQRLHDIVHSEFSLPRPSPPSSAPRNLDSYLLAASPAQEPPSSQNEAHTESQDPSERDLLSQQSSSTNKENNAPLMPPPAPAVSRHSAPRNMPSGDAEDPLGPFPDLAASPPYTVQRLAELVLHPRKHYRYLPPYLNALDRVVSVSSPTTSFPLPHQVVPNGILHTNGEEERSGNSSGDEGLGGALLTPIPWLRSAHAHEETARQPDGELHTEEQELREQGAVTQGELLRQEQEAGVVPVNQLNSRRGLMAARSGAMGPDMSASTEEPEQDDSPHARGPEDIGMEDLGPQAGAIGAGRPLDLEAALGRSKSTSPEPAGQETAAGGTNEMHSVDREHTKTIEEQSAETEPAAGEQ